MNTQKIKEQIKIHEYLHSIGLFPAKEKGDDVWFLSPFRKEQKPSFKVNKVLNLWYNHGLGKGGSIIDLVMMLHELNFDEAVKTLNEFYQKNIFSFHRQENNLSNIGSEKEKSAGQNTSVFQLKSISEITDIHLVEYIEKRAVQLQTARTFCHQLEIFNSRENFSFHAIGFKNRSNGFEIRTANFKACYAPKDYSFIDIDYQDLAIVEGFFDMLTAYENRHRLFLEPTNWLVLNSLNQTEKTETIIQTPQNPYLVGQ